MKYIQLNGKYSNNDFAIVDDSNYDLLSSYSWCIREVKEYSGKSYKYACTRVKEKVYMMHRMVMNVHLDSGSLVDHINHNTLDNREENLRVCNSSQNQANRFAYNKYSKYKGVRPKNNKWEAYISIDGKQKYLGVFLSEMDAAKAYDDHAKIHYGNFAKLNFQ